MKYVNDLTKVSPDEIEHMEDLTPIQSIIEVKRTIGTKQEIVVVIWESGECASYTKDGKFHLGGEQCFIFKAVKKEGWSNLYSYGVGGNHCGAVFTSKEEAIRVGKQDNHYITTIKLEWEE